MKDNLAVMFAVVLMVAAGYGWCANIVKLFGLHGLSGEMILRVIGIPAFPLGAILGFVG